MGAEPAVGDCFRWYWRWGAGVFGRCPQPGFVVELARETCAVLGLNCSLELARHGLFGGLDEEGGATGLVKDAVDASPSLRGGLGGPWPPPWGKFLYGGKGGPLRKGVILGNLGARPPMEICQRRA